MSAIDVWAQIPTARMARQPWLAPLLRWTGRGGLALSPELCAQFLSGNARRVFAL